MPDTPTEDTIRSRYELLYKLAIQWGLPTVIMCVLMYLAYLEHVYQREILTKANEFIQTGLTTIIKDNAMGNQKLSESVSANQSVLLQNQKLIMELTGAVQTMDRHVQVRLDKETAEQAN